MDKIKAEKFSKVHYGKTLRKMQEVSYEKERSRIRELSKNMDGSNEEIYASQKQQYMLTNKFSGALTGGYIFWGLTGYSWLRLTRIRAFSRNGALLAVGCSVTFPICAYLCSRYKKTIVNQAFDNLKDEDPKSFIVYR
jgi:hypothetical protein